MQQLLVPWWWDLFLKAALSWCSSWVWVPVITVITCDSTAETRVRLLVSCRWDHVLPRPVQACCKLLFSRTWSWRSNEVQTRRLITGAPGTRQPQSGSGADVPRCSLSESQADVIRIRVSYDLLIYYFYLWSFAFMSLSLVSPSARWRRPYTLTSFLNHGRRCVLHLYLKSLDSTQIYRRPDLRALVKPSNS